MFYSTKMANRSPFRCPKILFGPFRWLKSFSVFSRTGSQPLRKGRDLSPQFSSEFTKEDMSSMPSLGNSSYPRAPGLNIRVEGVTKILKGFRSQLVLSTQDLAMGLNGRSQTDAILLDFRKAFDKVPHQRLFLKFRHYGVRGNTLEWVKSLLDPASCPR